jgi:type I restriction enzyme M protein
VLGLIFLKYSSDSFEEKYNELLAEGENRKDKILFIDARKMGTMVTHKHRELSDEEIKQIYDTYHNWRDSFANKSLLVAESARVYNINEATHPSNIDYEDVQGFCKSAHI